MDGTWLDGPEAQTAIRMMGGLEAALEAPDQLLELMAHLREAAEDQPLGRWLNEHRLSFEDLTSLLADVAVAPPPPAERPGERLYTWPMSQPVRHAVVRLSLHAVEEPVIARLLDVDQDVVERYLAWRQRRNPHQDDIMRRHWAGETVRQIGRATGVAPKMIYDLLAKAGVEPNREQAEADPAVYRKVVALRRAGRSYAEIRKATGLNTNQVRNTLRRNKDQLDDYGKRRAS